MLIKKSIQKILFLLIIGSAITLNAGSLLGLRYPFGRPVTPLSGSSVLMGRTGVGVKDDHNIHIANPANLGYINTTAFSGLLTVDYIRAQENGSYTDMLDAAPNQVSFAIPLGKIGTAGFGLINKSNLEVQYESKINTTSTFQIDARGGATSWEIAWGISPLKQLSLGATLERRYSARTVTAISKKDDTTVRDSSHIMLRTWGITLGYMGSFSKLTAGISYNYIFSSPATYSEGIYNGIYFPNSIGNTKKTTVTDIQLPSKLDIGLSYKITPKLLVATDLSITMWQNYNDNLASLYGTSFVINNSPSLSGSIGLDFLPEPNLLYPKYWETIHYTGGGRYTQMPDGRGKEIVGSLGISLPLKHAGKLSLGVEGGKRSTADLSNFDEKFISLIIGLSGGKRWKNTSTEVY